MTVRTMMAVTAGVMAGATGLTGAPAHAATHTDTVLVRFSAQAGAHTRHAAARALDARAARPLLARWRAYQLRSPMRIDRARRALRGVPGVQAVLADASARPAADPAPQWHLSGPGADIGWSAAEVLWADRPLVPVGVAVIDTGMDITSPELAEAMLGVPAPTGRAVVSGWNFRARGPMVPDGRPSHATHVASIIAGRADNGLAGRGIAPNARILAGQFMDARGGSFADAVSAIAWARRSGAQVFNLSFAGAPYPPLCDAITQLGREGRVVVAAAGNEARSLDGTRVVRAPGGCQSPELISVAATDAAGARAGFSNTGATRVALGAPGVGISSDAGAGVAHTWSGTSLAAPMVSAAAALAYGLDPTLTPGRFRRLLLATSAPAPGLDATISGGRLRLDALLEAVIAGRDVSAPPMPVIGIAERAVTGARPAITWATPTPEQGRLRRTEIILDGRVVAQPAPGSGIWTPPAPLRAGVRTLVVRVSDSQGAQTETTRRFVVDVQPPSVAPAFTPAATTITPAGPVRFSWAPAQDPAGIGAYRIDVAGRSVNLPGDTHEITLTLPAGAHRWTLTAIDTVGNARTSSARRLTLR